MLKQMDSVLAQSNSLFVKMVDDTIALNQEILNYGPLELSSNVNIDWMFPIIKSAAQKRETKKPEQVQSVSAIAQIPGPKDDLKLITGVGPGLEKKLQDVGITSFEQIAKLSDLQIADLETDVLKFTGRIKRDDWIGQAEQLMKE
jgi:predicted flap endonuclease-1-like 5' DNA nuclease